MELDDSSSGNFTQTALSSMLVSGSPPQSGRCSPPLSSTPTVFQGIDAVELQIDYWIINKITIDGKDKAQAKDKDQGKNSIKSQFRSLQVSRKILLSSKFK